MIDYGEWLRRAVDFAEGIKALPGDVEVEIKVAPPISEAEVKRVVEASPLPIPKPLVRFWTEASGNGYCRYWWKTPAKFQEQREFAFPYWSLSHIWGGPEVISHTSILESSQFAKEQATYFEEYPRDARFWGNSLPFIEVGNGDSVGFYVGEDAENPPMVYLCHEGGGGSSLIAENFDEFLQQWETLGYIGIHFLCMFCDEESGMVNSDAFPEETRVVQSLLSGNARTGLVKKSRSISERDWLAGVQPERMLRWLEDMNAPDERKLRLFCCACLRRVWKHLGEWSKNAVEVSERYADGLASDIELSTAREGLSGQFGQDGRPNIVRMVEFSKSQGLMRHAVYNAVDADSFVCGDINRHLDDPDRSTEEHAQADLIRHIFGNPFSEPEQDTDFPSPIIRLAERLYEGEDVAADLCDALAGAGHTELAEHFSQPMHPKGCWALDFILGKSQRSN